MRVFRILCVVLSFLTVLSGCGTNDSSSYNMPSPQKQSNINDSQDTISSEGAKEEANIQSVENLFYEEVHEQTMMSGYLIADFPETTVKLMNMVDIGDVPALINEVDECVSSGEHYFLYYSFLERGIYTILRLGPNRVTSEVIDYFEELGRYYSPYQKERLVLGYSKVIKPTVEEIIASELTIEEKMTQLKEFGILAVPDVVEAIDSGCNEYETFFTDIGLHLSYGEYVNFIKLYDHGISWVECLTEEGFMDGAEDFDWRVWYEENEEDLNNLFKFLDAYCAEYEAETE